MIKKTGLALMLSAMPVKSDFCPTGSIRKIQL